jgi:hypothetical protein
VPSSFPENDQRGRPLSVNLRKLGEELARRTRKAQGLPSHVRNREVARKVAALLVKKAGGSP